MIRYSTMSICTALPCMYDYIWAPVQTTKRIHPGQMAPQWPFVPHFEQIASEGEEGVYTILRMTNRNAGKEEPRAPSHPPSGRGLTYLDGGVPKVGLYSCDWLRL